MTLLMLPRRRRMPRLTDHRITRDLKDLKGSLPEIPAVHMPDTLPDFSELVDAALEAGARQRKALPALRRRPRRRRATTFMLLFAVLGGLVIAYKWWNGRSGQPARLADAPDGPAGAPAEPRPSPWSVPTGEASSTSETGPWPMTSPQASTPTPASDRPVDPEVVAQTEPSEPPTERTASPAQALQPRASRSSEPGRERPERFAGRGISAARASIPSMRPSIPSRFSPHLPR